jgi:N-sulfoglucosamine sulfohydrolase
MDNGHIHPRSGCKNVADMNILYIHTHDSGRYFDPYGYSIQTPEIQKLAERGTIFRKAFCAAPTCSPSRAALLTGMSPHSCGMIGLAHRGFSLNDYDKHIVSQLNREGYDTALSGIQHVADPVSKIGYGHILDSWDYDMSKPFDFDTVDYDKSNADSSAKFIIQHRESEKPFFLSFGMFNTHRVFPPVSPDVDANYLLPPPPVKDTPENREDYAGYVTSARVVDDCLKTVMDALDEAKLRDNTIVIFTTDHGIAFPDMKCSLYDSGIGVTLLIDYPGNQMKGLASDAMVSHLDIYPTICDLIGIDKPKWLEGVSLQPLLEEKQESVREEIYAEVTYHAAYEPMRCIRTERYKLIRRFDSPFTVIPSNSDDCSGKSLLLASNYHLTQRGEYMLFDMNVDPMERNNLIDNPEYRKIFESLESKLKLWMISTDDPLLAGPVPLPAGAFANQRSCRSPDEQLFDFG